MDPVAQMLNEMKNAQAVSKETVSFSYSNFKHEILKVLEKFDYISKVEKKGRGVKKVLDVILKYEDGLPMISSFKKVSKPSQRTYSPTSKIKSTKGGRGIVIVSTSKGVMPGFLAKKNNLGGEVICEIW
ncbi:30S ribosomal protein S8 [Candidatus Parcubacteria bacterium]|nr:30S ribosomal protein S8 [Patescibacteria group bacterium]MBU4466774.1 30S ribosomal protein S8 [Patescibacteria group bacterium]MCG2688238.1 30S ribosomal protein S8 [Candidatus Parcubacteria bacterium]